MNGRELLEALSHIDEELLAAAEKPRRRNPFRQWVSLAACLCILVLGIFSFRQLFRNGATEGAADEAATQAAMAAGSERSADSALPECAEEEPGEMPAFDITTEGEATALLTARVRVIELTEDGFTALILTERQDLEGLTVTAIPGEGVELSGVETGKEYTVQYAPSEEDGILRIFHMKPAE